MNGCLLGPWFLLQEELCHGGQVKNVFAFVLYYKVFFSLCLPPPQSPFRTFDEYPSPMNMLSFLYSLQLQKREKLNLQCSLKILSRYSPKKQPKYKLVLHRYTFNLLSNHFLARFLHPDSLFVTIALYDCLVQLKYY